MFVVSPIRIFWWFGKHGFPATQGGISTIDPSYWSYQLSSHKSEINPPKNPQKTNMFGENSSFYKPPALRDSDRAAPCRTAARPVTAPFRSRRAIRSPRASSRCPHCRALLRAERRGWCDLGSSRNPGLKPTVSLLAGAPILMKSWLIYKL